MYNIAIAFASGFVVFLLTSQAMGPIPAVLPGLLVTGVAMFLLSRRTARAVEAEMAELMPLMQERRIDEAVAKLASIKARYGRWQLMLEGQMDAQIGMIDYLQMKFDEALPRLEAGKFRNWTALTCIGCIHWRRGRKEQAYEAFAAAAAAAPKESIIYLVWTTLLVRDGKREEALKAIGEGVKANPDAQTLKNLQKTVANKKKISTKHFPQTWYQFFPEDMARQMTMRGRRGPLPEGAPQMPQAPRIGARRAPRR
jgi:tetratricopeptide (TPR) repeat protein